jgi:CHAT domain-containing protein
VAIGNPQFNADSFPTLPSLPAAADEARRIAGTYQQALTLIGTQGTFGNLAANAPYADIIDIAAHSIHDAEPDRKPTLVLAADGRSSGACGVASIQSLKLKSGSTVVVCGCQTAISDEPFGDLRDFAGSFLAAGAQTTVATLWDVDDSAARDFAVLFHRRVAKGQAPATAARLAQMSMLHSPDARQRDPSAWSAFQVYSLSR